jgi:nucleotide-binding universal stress UspA family protein
MKRILIVFQGIGFPYLILENAITLARDTQAVLVGVFLKEFTRRGPGYPFFNDMALTGVELYAGHLEAEDSELIRKHTDMFTQHCKSSGIKYAVHNAEGTPIESLLRETVFADIVVIDAKASLNTSHPDNKISAPLKELLIDSKCPALITDNSFRFFKNIILTYDGSLSSIYSIKLFTYVFAAYKQLPASLVSINRAAGDEMKEEKLIMEFLDQHYPGISYSLLNGDPYTVLPEFVKTYPDPVVVMGAYGRSALSRFFHASLADKILLETNAPLFIAHQ